MSRPPRDPVDDYRPEAVAARHRWLNLDLPRLSGAPPSFEDARGRVEGLIGFLAVPVGIAAPLRLRGEVVGDYRVPFATTEGTMVASYQRGFKLAEAAGGVEVKVTREGLTVWPTLAYETLAEADRVRRLILDAPGPLIALAEATTRHGRVLSLHAELLGTRVVVALTMYTGDAQGINMVTRAAEALLRGLPPARQTLIHGLDAEKRASTAHARGRSVTAALLVPGSLLTQQLGVGSAALAELWATYQLGFARMGTANHALQIANGLAAMYLATGQDVAYVAESAVGSLSLEDRGGDLLATLDLPSLHVGTVGGGTGVGTAAECLRILGVQGARELAAVFAGALLCGDLNLAASFLVGRFMDAHDRLGSPGRRTPPG